MGECTGRREVSSTARGLHAVTALIHVHTTLSDGQATAEEIARSAARCGVEVVVITDHDRSFAGPRWVEGVLLVAGREASPRHNHLILVGGDTPPPRPREEGPEGDMAAELARARAAGAWTALAHPLDPALPLVASSRSFVALDMAAGVEADGLELWNAMSAFKRGLDNPWLGLGRVFLPGRCLAGPHPVVLALWDTVGRRRRWPAFAGADAHGFSSGRAWLPLRIYSYRRHMRLLTTGLWLERPFTGRAEADQELVIDALRAGRAYCALGRARGFSCRLRGPGGRVWPPGAELAHGPGLVVEVELPARGWARLLCHGRPVFQGRGRYFSWPVEGAGVWRLEVFRRRRPGGWRPWIYCNPFYLREERA